MAKSQNENVNEQTNAAPEPDWQQRVQELEKQIESLKKAHDSVSGARATTPADDKLSVLLDVLVKNQQVIMDNQKTMAERAELARKEWVEIQQKLIDAKDTELLNGAELFHVKLPGTNMDLPKLVGANNRDEALGKFNRYFGINASAQIHEITQLTDTDHPRDEVLKDQKAEDIKNRTPVTRSRTQFSDIAV